MQTKIDDPTLNEIKKVLKSKYKCHTALLYGSRARGAARADQRLVRRIENHIKKPFKPMPKYEIDVTKAWPEKQLDRISVGDVHGLYRRTELQAAALSDYFQIRRKRFCGPKAGLNWLAENDPTTFKLFSRVFKSPTDMRALKALVNRVYKT